MNVLLIGANGFVGRGVRGALEGQHEIVPAGMGIQDGKEINLEDPVSIAAVLSDVRPDAIVNCAGVVDNSEAAKKNVVFTRNLLEQIVATSVPLQRIVLLGSAAEYGLVEKLPVNEDVPRNPTSLYGESKKEEVDLALKYRDEQKLPIVVARLFNPIGTGMAPRMLISGILRQIAAVRAGETDKIEVSRLDAKRDYLDVSDVGLAIAALLEGEPKHAVYNIGSGVCTTNEELIRAMLAESDLATQPKLTETSDRPEPLFAIQADISRISGEFGWSPQKQLTDTIREVMHAN